MNACLRVVTRGHSIYFSVSLEISETTVIPPAMSIYVLAQNLAAGGQSTAFLPGSHQVAVFETHT